MSDIELRKEQYVLVTHRQEYHADRVTIAFQFYIKVFATLVVAGITLVSTSSPLKLEPATIPLFLYTITSLISIVGIVSIIQIIMSLKSWKGCRVAEIEINTNAPKIPKYWWMFEILYCFLILISIFLSWIGANFLIK